MADPNTSWGEIVTTTLEARSKKLADNVTENNALLNRLRERGNIRTVSGGNVIVEELEYAENSTFMRYSGYETLNISPSVVFSAAEFALKQAAVAVSMSGLEMLQNAGPEQVIDLLEKRIKNAERTMANNISADIYSNGTADSSRQIGGLQLLVADDSTTGTVGGINRATSSNAFWRSQLFDFSVASLTAGPTTIQTAMNRLYLSCKRGPDAPDLIVADNTYFRYYWESLQAIQRIQSLGTAEAGYQALKFMGSDVICDGGIGGNCPSNHMYFLNTNYLFFRPHRDRNFVPDKAGERYATNQDAIVRLIFWAGNMTLSNAQLQGVIIA